jgi:DNA-binding Xre family transcriptional regulator
MRTRKTRMRYKLKVKEVAESKGVNRAKLSRQADMSYETVFRIWKDPYHDVSFSVLLKLATALNCDIKELYDVIPDD